MAAALLLSVVALVAGGLVAWRWWLAHLAEERAVKARDIDAAVAKVLGFEQQVVQLELALRKLEVRTAGR